MVISFQGAKNPAALMAQKNPAAFKAQKNPAPQQGWFDGIILRLRVSQFNDHDVFEW